MEQLFGLIKEARLDGIAWFNPPDGAEPFAKELFEGGLPLVSVFGDFKSVPCLDVDPEADGCRLGKFLVAEKRRSLFFALNTSDYSDGVLRGLRKVYGEAGYELNARLIFSDKANFCRELRDALEFGAVPDAFYIDGGLAEKVMEMLLERKIDVKERCRLIADSYATELPGFHGVVKRPPFEALGAKCAEMLCRMVRGRDMLVERARFDFSMKFEGREI